LADTLAYFDEEKEVLYQRFFVAMLLGRKEANDRKSYRSGKRLNKKVLFAVWLLGGKSLELSR